MTKSQYIEQLFDTMTQLKKLLEIHAQDSYEVRAATFMQFSTLRFLKECKNCTLGDVAAFMKVSKSSATQLIERLVKATLVEKNIDKEDRRITHLKLTKKGEIEIIALKKKFMDRMKKAFLKIPDQDLAEMIRIHTSIINTLQKEKK